jgi:hypothetical protein
MRSGHLRAEGVCQEILGEAAHSAAIIHQGSQELVEQLAAPLHKVLTTPTPQQSATPPL